MISKKYKLLDIITAIKYEGEHNRIIFYPVYRITRNFFNIITIEQIVGGCNDFHWMKSYSRCLDSLGFRYIHDYVGGFYITVTDIDPITIVNFSNVVMFPFYEAIINKEDLCTVKVIVEEKLNEFCNSYASDNFSLCK